MRELRGVDHDHLVDTGLGLQHAGGCIQSHLKIGVLLGRAALAAWILLLEELAIQLFSLAPDRDADSMGIHSEHRLCEE